MVVPVGAALAIAIIAIASCAFGALACFWRSQQKHRNNSEPLHWTLAMPDWLASLSKPVSSSGRVIDKLACQMEGEACLRREQLLLSVSCRLAIQSQKF
ncbi:hypothetical protein LIER_37295 [Lithospermum erythrorhizon]|uniref:Uncharacterized protein n=1 Tax=Lithospermum erythrorhizon TaxID=34254 RepID=A0AAV3PNB9_LITER